MPGTSARNAEVHINGFDLSAYFRGLDISDDISLEDDTPFGSSRTAKTFVPTLMESTLSLKGFWNPTAVSGVNVALRAALANATKSNVCIWPVGSTVGNPGMAMSADLGSRKVQGEVAGLVTLEAEFKSSVGDEDVVSLHALAAETIDGNGTIVDNGASTASGGAIYLQHQSVTTNNIVTVRHSTDNFGASDVLLGTFATVTAANKSERIALTGTINRYVRVVWDLTGAATFSASIYRG